jgi:hypothetical protein
MALPEIKAWSAHIEKAWRTGAWRRDGNDAGDASHRWRRLLSAELFESTPDAAHRWESFIVSPDGKRILVDDVVSGELLSLERWRDNAPMQRIATQ